MAVTRTSTGALFSSAASGTVTFGAGAAAGNLGILIVETANQAITTPTGWTLDKQSGTGTAGAAGATMLSIYYKASISAGDVSGGIAISDSGDHQNAVLLTYSGHDVNGRYGVGAPLSGAGLNVITPASISAGSNGVASAGTGLVGDIFLGIIVTDRDSATLSTNTSPVWNNIAGSNSFIENLSSATGAGGGIIVNELVPSGSSTAAVSFGCSITSSIMIVGAYQIYAPASGTTYNDNLSESAAAAATLANAESFASAEAESAAAADSLNPAGSTFGVPLAESSAAADSASSTQTFVNTLAESAAASDSLTGGLLLTGSVNETAAAADALANAVTWGPAQTESAAANDSLASSATFGSALGETAATNDSLTAGNIIAATRAESAAAADSETAAQTFVSSLTETAASADALSAGLVIAKSLNESAAAADSATVAVTFNSGLAESAAAGDAEASSQTMGNALGESATAGDAETSRQTFNASLSESAGASDSVSAGARVYNDSVSEAAAAGDTEAAAAAMAAAASESAAAADAAAARSTLAGAIGEQAGASDQASSAQASSAALGETSGASDSATAGVTYGVTVNENLAALQSLGVGLVLPASVGETATAGDDETARADLAAALDEQASANDDYEATVVAVITHQMAVLQAVKALVQAALPDMALGFTADSDKKARAGQREIGQARAAVEIEYEFGSNAQVFRQPIGIVLTAPGGFGGLALDDMGAAIGTAILADRTLGGLVDWIEASAATIASRSARGVASLNWATIVITAEYRTEGALAA